MKVQELNYTMSDIYPYQVMWKGRFGSGTLYYRSLAELYLAVKAGEFSGREYQAVHIKEDRSIAMVAV